MYQEVHIPGEYSIFILNNIAYHVNRSVEITNNHEKIIERLAAYVMFNDNIEILETLNTNERPFRFERIFRAFYQKTDELIPQVKSHMNSFDNISNHFRSIDHCYHRINELKLLEAMNETRNHFHIHRHKHFS